jgi:hypothetical protein
MSKYLEENYYAFEEIKPHVLTHLTNLDSNFKNRFQELILQQHEWLQSQSVRKQVTFYKSQGISDGIFLRHISPDQV